MLCNAINSQSQSYFIIIRTTERSKLPLFFYYLVWDSIPLDAFRFTTNRGVIGCSRRESWKRLPPETREEFVRDFDRMIRNNRDRRQESEKKSIEETHQVNRWRNGSRRSTVKTAREIQVTNLYGGNGRDQ